MNHSEVNTPGRRSSPAPATSLPAGDAGEINFDLTKEDASPEERKEGFTLLKASAALPASSDRRQAYYDTIITPVHHSITDLQIGALEALTNGGRTLAPFEADLVIFLNKTLGDLSAITEQLREDNRGVGPRKSIYGAESPIRGTEKSLPANEPSGAEKALLVWSRKISLIDKVTNHCVLGHFLPDCKYHYSASVRVSRCTVGDLGQYRHSHC